MELDEIKTGLIVNIDVEGSQEHGFYGYVDRVNEVNGMNGPEPVVIVRFYPSDGDDSKSFIRSYSPADIDVDGMWDEGHHGNDVVTLEDQYQWSVDMFAECYGGLPAEEEIYRLAQAGEIVKALAYVLEAERWSQKFIEKITEYMEEASG
ncbi:MAG: hypothetical protein ACYTBJ_00645 [Planctomycetota bacterium]|jgi:hypothetical protein